MLIENLSILSTPTFFERLIDIGSAVVESLLFVDPNLLILLDLTIGSTKLYKCVNVL